ncbi:MULTISPECIES: hypothetical protein [Limnospira]|uniref:hypothetical protein n=1 Tax=Limnospira TaxID=2596745 RepID=UPI0001D0ED90|nr:hypothetical protein [Arthrospira platensis]MDT9295587.1 hypothetical protein [Arthrospira platensis PCC 7345]BAI88448.1 hypothetical protein NIES39_A06100 [Arthrospira platensis NIES-39]
MQNYPCFPGVAFPRSHIAYKMRKRISGIAGYLSPHGNCPAGDWVRAPGCG